MKPNLDLSEFERCGEILHKPLLREVKPETTSKQHPTVILPAHTAERERKSHEIGRYKFIPVGFGPEHLVLLDDAVFNLKRKGYLKASRSGIIRILIERHAREVIENYREPIQ